MTRASALTRRSVLAGLAGSAAAFAAGPSWASVPGSVDVVIVGAGAAGIGAAMQLQKMGNRKFFIVEAAGRIGGRAYTDDRTFEDGHGKPIPFDIGCGWIHRGTDDNPFVQFAKDIFKDRYNEIIKRHELERIDYLTYWGCGRKPWPPDQLQHDLETSDEYLATKIDAAAAEGDLPANRKIDDWRRPIDAAATFLGPMDAAVDIANLSALDSVHTADYEPNLFVKTGYGALVKQVAETNGVTAPNRCALNTAVTEVAYNLPGPYPVRVHLNNKLPIRAKAVIVTVSTGVLAGGAIRFTPDLRDDYQDAIGNLPMGLLAKIPLQVKSLKNYLGPKNIKPFDNVMDQRAGLQDIWFLASPWDSDLMVGFVGGDFAWQLSAAGKKAAVNFATGRLGDILGCAWKKQITATLPTGITDWASNPHTLGAYAAALPGHFDARAKLREPVDGLVFFAGEALAPPVADPKDDKRYGMWGTCSGAYLSGLDVANKVMASLKSA
jgi:monoamine oxidase